MVNEYKKLELTWIGKDVQPKLEPRILLEDPDKSYGSRNTKNMLIHGDNLLALKALEQDFAGKIKCVYIDPPFNTQQAFEHYDDGLEHSIWLSLMRNRLLLINRLLSQDGACFIHIDDNELGYLTVITDEIFGRDNRVAVITFKQGSPTGHKSINPGFVSTTNFLLVYAKNKAQWHPPKLYTARDRNQRYNQFILNKSAHHSKWQITTLAKAFADCQNLDVRTAKKTLKEYEELLCSFVTENAESVIQLARPSYSGVSSAARELIDKSKHNPSTIYYLKRDGYSDMFFLKGERILFYSDTLKDIDGTLTPGEPLTTIWDDLHSHNLHNEGEVSFPKGKKPESLLKRVIELSTDPQDYVLDSFAGSGTTGAVAQKMGRKWIMVELGDHCATHCIPRLRIVCDGTDQSGISKSVNWKGGGGFKYYELAPSLLGKDNFDMWVINKEYNAVMLAAAMAKHENFKYCPDATHYWKQGRSSENDFIFTTTTHLTRQKLDRIHQDMRSDESLLICCKSHFEKAGNQYRNITVKKIPAMLLGRCEFGKEDYSLNIVDMPRDPDESEFKPVGPNDDKARKSIANRDQLNIFTGLED